MIALAAGFVHYAVCAARQATQHARMRRLCPGASLDPRIAWQVQCADNLSIECETHIGPYSQIVVLGKSSFSQVEGRLHIGSRTVIGAFANIRAAGGSIDIGRNCLIAQGVSIIAANHKIIPGYIHRDAPWDESRTGVAIMDNCWVGAGASILPGVTVGSAAILAAGSVLTKSVPSGEIWAGVPARRIGFVGRESES